MFVGEFWKPETHLPPPDYWLFDPKSERIPVPVDSRGLVDAVQAARFLRSIIAPEYQWRFRSDRHHEYHEAEDYRYQDEKSFRNLPINIIRLPQDAHALWHYVFDKPQKPDQELMYYMGLAFRVTVGTFQDASEIIRLERHKKRLIKGEFLPRKGEIRTIESRNRGIDFHKRRLERRLEIYETLPPEHVLAEIRTGATPRNIAAELGSLAFVRTPIRSLLPVLQ